MVLTFLMEIYLFTAGSTFLKLLKHTEIFNILNIVPAVGINLKFKYL